MVSTSYTVKPEVNGVREYPPPTGRYYTSHGNGQCYIILLQKNTVGNWKEYCNLT